MRNGLKIRWTEEATKNLESIIAEKDNEKRRLETELNIKNGIIFEKEDKLRDRCVLSKNLTIYYTVEDEYLVLLSIFDTRQHPSNMKI